MWKGQLAVPYKAACVLLTGNPTSLLIIIWFNLSNKSNPNITSAPQWWAVYVNAARFLLILSTLKGVNVDIHVSIIAVLHVHFDLTGVRLAEWLKKCWFCSTIGLFRRKHDSFSHIHYSTVQLFQVNATCNTNTDINRINQQQYFKSIWSFLQVVYFPSYDMYSWIYYTVLFWSGDIAQYVWTTLITWGCAHKLLTKLPKGFRQ